MKIFVDTNILLDVLLQREPFYEKSAIIWSLVKNNKLKAYISALSITNIFYIVKKTVGIEKAFEIVRIILKTFNIVEVNFEVLIKAEETKMKDYEDAVQYICAENSNCTKLITRNKKDFNSSDIIILNPEEFLNELEM